MDFNLNNVSVLYRGWNHSIEKATDHHEIFRLIFDSRSIVRKTEQSRYVYTITDEIVEPKYQLMGMPSPGGSVQMDCMCKRILYEPKGISYAESRLGLIHGKLDVEQLLSNWETVRTLHLLPPDKLTNIIGHEYEDQEIKNAAINIFHKKQRSPINATGSPRYQGKHELIMEFVTQQNSQWGMFYAEFYRFLNYYQKNVRLLMPNSFGFDWAVERTSKIGTLVGIEKADEMVLRTIRVVTDLVRTVIRNTPCLLDPVGAQHLFMFPLQIIKEKFDDVVDFVTSEDFFLGSSSKYGVFDIKQDMDPTTAAWQGIRLMILNTSLVLNRAMSITSSFMQLLLKLQQGFVPFQKSQIDLARKEGGHLFGYYLRDSSVRWALQDGNGDPSVTYVPFNFHRFCVCLSYYTRVPVESYSAPMFNFYSKALELIHKNLSTRVLNLSWNCCMLPENSPFMDTFLQRMMMEGKNKSIKAKVGGGLHHRKEFKVDHSTFYPYNEGSGPLVSLGLRIAMTNGLKYLHRPPPAGVIKNEGLSDYLSYESRGHVGVSAQVARFSAAFVITRAAKKSLFRARLADPQRNHAKSYLRLKRQKNHARNVKKNQKMKGKRERRRNQQRWLIWSSKLQNRKLISELKLAAENFREKHEIVIACEREADRRVKAGFSLLSMGLTRINIVDGLRYLRRQLVMRKLKEKLEFYLIYNEEEDPFLDGHLDTRGFVDLRVFLKFPTISSIVSSFQEPLFLLYDSAKLSGSFEIEYQFRIRYPGYIERRLRLNQNRVIARQNRWIAYQQHQQYVLHQQFQYYTQAQIYPYFYYVQPH